MTLSPKVQLARGRAGASLPEMIGESFMRVFLTGLMASTAALALSAAANAADYVFATPDEAYAILSADDEFTVRLQPMEIGLRLEDNAQISREALNALYRDSVRDFDAATLRAQLRRDGVALDLETGYLDAMPGVEPLEPPR